MTEDAPETTKKVTVTLQLDEDIVRWFIKNKNGYDYHTLINDSLRVYMESKKKQRVKIARIEQIKKQLAKRGLRG